MTRIDHLKLVIPTTHPALAQVLAHEAVHKLALELRRTKDPHKAAGAVEQQLGSQR